MSEIPTTSVRPGSKSSPSSTPSSAQTQPDPQHLRFAMTRADMLLRCYPNGQAYDAEMYMAAISVALSDYSVEVITFVTDPRTGIWRESDYLPSGAKVIAACEAAKKALTPPLLVPTHGEMVTEKSLHPLIAETHRGKVFVMRDSPEWDAWVSYTAQNYKRPFHPSFFGGFTFPTRWPPGREPGDTILQPKKQKTEA